MATVYRRGQTYWIRFQWRGKLVRRSAKTSSKAVALQFLAQAIDEHQRLDRGGRPRRSYKEALARFELEYLPTLKPGTQSRYRSSFRQLAPFIGDLHLDEITKGVLAEYVSARRSTGTSGSTIRRDLATLSAVCSFAVAIDMIEDNPVRKFSRRHIREPAPRTTYPPDDEIERLIAATTPTMGRVIRFLAQTGMRREEVVSLEWSQVSLHRREVKLIKTKTSSPRVVPLSDAAHETLVTTPRHSTSPFVFWHGDGERYQRFSGHFRRLAKRVGFRYRCHDLRHRFASVFLQATGDIAALQAVLGHRSIEMTMRYSHLLTEHLHEAVAKAGTKLDTKAGTRVPVAPTSTSSRPITERETSLSVQPTYAWTATVTISKPSQRKDGEP
jgi:integrase